MRGKGEAREHVEVNTLLNSPMATRSTAHDEGMPGVGEPADPAVRIYRSPAPPPIETHLQLVELRHLVFKLQDARLGGGVIDVGAGAEGKITLEGLRGGGGKWRSVRGRG